MSKTDGKSDDLNGGAGPRSVAALPSDDQRRREFRCPMSGAGELRIGRRWHPTNIVNQSCSGFQVALAPNKKVAPDQILRFRGDAGEFLVRVARVESNGQLGLEWILEANSYDASRGAKSLVRSSASGRLRQLGFCLLLGVIAGLLMHHFGPDLSP